MTPLEFLIIQRQEAKLGRPLAPDELDAATVAAVWTTALQAPCTAETGDETTIVAGLCRSCREARGRWPTLEELPAFYQIANATRPDGAPLS